MSWQTPTIMIILFAFILGTVADKAADEREEELYCDCSKSCAWKYTNNVKPESEILLACRKGCRLFYLLARIPAKQLGLIKEEQDIDACPFTCGLTLGGKLLVEACVHGCRKGCKKHLPPPPKVKVAIVIEDEVVYAENTDLATLTGSDSDFDPVLLLDPGMRRQLEIQFSPSSPIKTKIPVSYFTNLPIIREHTRGCQESRNCENLIVLEPVVCFCLVLALFVILMFVYWRRFSAKYFPSPASLINPKPEKVPLKLEV